MIISEETARLGANKGDLTRLIESGVLFHPHPGVYVTAGASGDPHLATRAAVAAAGRGRRAGRTPAAASHASAAWLQGMLEAPPHLIHVTVTSGWSRHLDGVVVHRTTRPIAALPYKGIRCTPPTRTLVDLAADAPPSVIERAIDRTLAKRLVRVQDLEGGLNGEASGRRGVGYLRARLLDRGYVGGPSPSVLESDMGRLLRRSGLPVPKAEVRAGPDGRYSIDYAYSSRRVAVEVYGYTWHHAPDQLTGDMARQRQLTLEGWTVLIYTWQDVQQDPERVAAEISTALGMRTDVAC